MQHIPRRITLRRWEQWGISDEIVYTIVKEEHPASGCHMSLQELAFHRGVKPLFVPSEGILI